MISTLPDYPALRAIQNALWHVGDVRGAAVMVGSGFSTNAQLASPESKAPPLWRQMEAEMRKQLGVGSSETLGALRLAEEFRALLGQPALDGFIRGMVPDAEWLPGEPHKRLLELPWADILTTNWDTLIERSRVNVFERSYDVVLAPRDIARTRAPRIIKLHGSMPSQTPFIFAEEDYRTYPYNFAPFVNLAQNIFLENEILLIGFSGDDPNFLAWAGWVRDQLGTSARKIRLAGVLDLSPARRKYLENLNVSPIDLGPILDSKIPTNERHARGTRLLLDSLHAARPTPVHVWKRSGSSASLKPQEGDFAVEISDLVKSWESDRTTAPSWLVMPFGDRQDLRIDTGKDLNTRVLDKIKLADDSLRGRFALELAWRLEVSHSSLTKSMRNILRNACDDPKCGLSGNETTRIRVLLCYNALEERDTETFELELNKLEADNEQGNEASAWAAYLKGLYARNRLDCAGVIAALPAIAGSDPIWMLRRAGLHCAICENTEAANLVRSALSEIRRRRALDRNSLWLLSREAWAYFLWSALKLFSNDEAEESHVKFQVSRTDPMEEINQIDLYLHAELERESRYSAEDNLYAEHEDSVTNSASITRVTADWMTPAEYMVSRLADFVGIPVHAGFRNIIHGRLNRSIRQSRYYSSEDWTWRAASYAHSESDVRQWFSSIQVAALPSSIVSELSCSLQSAVKHFSTQETKNDSDYMARIERLRTLMQMLTALAARSGTAEAQSLVKLAVSVLESDAKAHWWLYKAAANLIDAALSAIPPEKRGEQASLMLNFPLPGERKLSGIENDWPEFSESFLHNLTVIVRPSEAWNNRIKQLISWVQRDTGTSRHRAIKRLALLNAKLALTSDEAQSFANAIWSNQLSPQGLPASTSFFPSAFLTLPEPELGVAAAAFDNDIVQPLLSGIIPDLALQSLIYAGRTAMRGNIQAPLSSSTSLAILRQLPKPSVRHSEQLIASVIVDGLLPFLHLDDAAAEDLWVRATEKSSPYSIQFLPYVAAHFPDRTKEAVAKIRRAMHAREAGTVSSALRAVSRWAELSRDSTFPASLASATASIVDMRREPSLFRALQVSEALAKRNLLSEDDLQRILDGLADLLNETDYKRLRKDDIHKTTLISVRKCAYRLAMTLAGTGRSDDIVLQWISSGESDPLPEVRYVSPGLGI